MIVFRGKIHSISVGIFFCVMASFSLIGCEAAAAAGSAVELTDRRISTDQGWRLRRSFAIEGYPRADEDIRDIHQGMMGLEKLFTKYVSFDEKSEKQNKVLIRFSLLARKQDGPQVSILLNLPLNNVIFVSGGSEQRAEAEPAGEFFFQKLTQDKTRRNGLMREELLQDLDKKIPGDIVSERITDETRREIGELLQEQTRKFEKQAQELDQISIYQALALSRMSIINRLHFLWGAARGDYRGWLCNTHTYEKAWKRLDKTKQEQREIQINQTALGATDNESELGHAKKEIEEKCKEIDTALKQLQAITHLFNHSEQLALQYLHKDNVINEITDNIAAIVDQQKLEIDGLVMHLYSSNGPCENCAPMIHLECENEKGVAQKLKYKIAHKLGLDLSKLYFLLFFSCRQLYPDNTFCGIDEESKKDVPIDLYTFKSFYESFYPVISFIPTVKGKPIEELHRDCFSPREIFERRGNPPGAAERGGATEPVLSGKGKGCDTGGAGSAGD